MSEFIKKQWKWILLLLLIAVGAYVMAWYYFKVIRATKEEESNGEA